MTNKNHKPHNDKNREAVRKLIELPSRSKWGLFGSKILLTPFTFIYKTLIIFGDTLINLGNFLWLGFTNFPHLISEIFSKFSIKKTVVKNSVNPTNSKLTEVVVNLNVAKPTAKLEHKQLKPKTQNYFFTNLFSKFKAKKEIKTDVQKLENPSSTSTIKPQISTKPASHLKTKPNVLKTEINQEISNINEIDFSSSSSKEILQNLANLVNSLAQNDRVYRQGLQKKVKIGQYLIFGAILILVVNTVFVLFQSPFQNANAGTATQTTTGVQNLITDTTQPGMRVVENFLSNKFVAEVGSSINIQKDKIITKGTNNCKTPVPPPSQNGCEFVLLPSSLSIPIRGTLFKTIKFEATVTGDSEILITKKNYEKGRIIDTIGSITATNLNKKMVLPESILGVEGLEIKLWERGGTIEIRKIIIEYFNVETMVPVAGKINNWKATSPVLGSIYLDINENKKFDVKTDKPWICKPNFPGLVSVNIDTDGSFVMYRDDSCFIDVKPDFFYTDEKKSVLPPGDWLLVLDNGKEVYNFTIEVKDKEKILELESVN